MRELHIRSHLFEREGVSHSVDMEEALDSSDCQTDVENTDDELANKNVNVKEDQRVVSYQEIEGSVQTQSFSVKSNTNSWTENMDQATLIEKLKKEKRQLQENLSRFVSHCSFILLLYSKFEKVHGGDSVF